MIIEKLLDPDEIIGNIKIWQKSLKCNECNCKNEAKVVYIEEGFDQIYCELHAKPTDHQTIPLKFENELNIDESLLNALEKKLVYVQKQMDSIRSENFSFYPDTLNGKKMKELEDTFNKLKNTISSLWIKVKSISKNEKNETTNREAKNKYVSLDFIREEWKKCSSFCSEIDSTISEMLRDKQADYIIQTLVNSNKGNVEFEEEHKLCEFLKVPNEIYGKKYKVVETSFQSIISIKKVWR